MANFELKTGVITRGGNVKLKKEVKRKKIEVKSSKGLLTNWNWSKSRQSGSETIEILRNGSKYRVIKQLECGIWGVWGPYYSRPFITCGDIGTAIHSAVPFISREIMASDSGSWNGVLRRYSGGHKPEFFAGNSLKSAKKKRNRGNSKINRKKSTNQLALNRNHHK